MKRWDRLNRVVAQFLDYSKPHAAELRPTDLSKLVEKTVGLMRPAIPESITFDFKPAARRLEVMASAEQIRQVLINLIQNSVKAIESKSATAVGNGTRHIRIRLETEGRDDASQAVVHVEDSGGGINSQDMDKLFIPFFTTSVSGTGLGLSISQKIVEAHRGRIEVATAVASEVGKLTRFSVVLPRHLAQVGGG